MSGNRTIIFLGLLWFFGARIEHEVEGAFVNIVVGPFIKQTECEEYRVKALEMIKLTGGSITPKCISKEEL
jgi:hypothetical protein